MGSHYGHLHSTVAHQEYRVNRKGNASEDHLIDYATDPKNLADSLASSIESYTQRLAHRQILKRYPE